jgi:uncharacterized protein YndB with AHSA1/START domain
VTTQASIAPVRKGITVRRPVEEAFRLFTAEMASWWPLSTHSLAEAKAETVVFEPRAGGRLYERKADGSVSYWAEVAVWEPPRRFVLAWQPNPEAPAATEVEVTFTEEGAGTRVDLEHRGWERLGAAADEKRREYDTGWDGVLALYGGASRGNGLAVASLIVGVASLVPLLGVVAAPFAIGLGMLGLGRARKGAPHGGLAVAGLVLGIVGVLVTAFVLSWAVYPGEGEAPIHPPEETPAP